jgi:deoxycytidine triphosphate deaminase
MGASERIPACYGQGHGQWSTGLLCDAQIRHLAMHHGMIEPFEPDPVRISGGFRVVSYGTTSYGYDMRVADEWKVFTPTGRNIVVDPKEMDPRSFVEVKGDRCVVIPPNSFVLARSVERFKIPRDVLAIIVGKSTYARCGLVVNCTPLEPCLSADSEILTADGWRGMADVKVGDYVLTRREDGVAEYQSVERKQAREFRGQMMHFDGRSVDQLVTPEHKVFARLRNPHAGTERAGTYEAHSIFGKHGYSFDREVAWVAPEPAPSHVEINGLRYPFDAFLRFMGCYLGDGSAYHGADRGYSIKLAVVTKEKKRDTFRAVLKAMGVEAREHERGFHFYSKPLATYLMQFGHAREKFIDKRWKNLPPEKLGLLIEGLMASDGCATTNTYTTSSRQLADDVQEIAFKSGAAAIVREVEDEINGVRLRGFKVRICEVHMTPKMPPKNHKLVDYDGMVYDVTVPNHVFFMRRDGKASWTGNCWEGYLTIEISNTTPLPARVYAMEGIAQVLFFKASQPCVQSYAEKDGGAPGKYQNQGPEIITPRM